MFDSSALRRAISASSDNRVVRSAVAARSAAIRASRSDSALAIAFLAEASALLAEASDFLAEATAAFNDLNKSPGSGSNSPRNQYRTQLLCGQICK